MKKMMAPRIWGTTYQRWNCPLTTSDVRSEPESNTTPSADSVSGTSNASSWATARIPPISAYLLFELQPARNTDGKARLVMAKRNSTPTPTSPSTAPRLKGITR